MHSSIPILNKVSFRGTIEDFVKCQKCTTERVKQDVFLDLPLAVKQFGIAESYKSVVSFYYN